MFSHGINVIGLWIVSNAIEKQTGTTKLSELGGLAKTAPSLAILLVIMALANIALPLTNAFVGEFLMFNGLFAYSATYAAIAGLSVILSAVYTLNMIQKIFFGELSTTYSMKDIPKNTVVALVVIVAMIFVMGVFPKPMFELGQQTYSFLVKK